MKKFRYLITIIVVATMGLLTISSCSKTSNELLGNWYYEEELEDFVMKITLHFSRNLTGYQKLEALNMQEKQEFKYVYDKSTKDLELKYDNGFSETFQAEVKSGKLNIIDYYGSVTTFHR